MLCGVGTPLMCALNTYVLFLTRALGDAGGWGTPAVGGRRGLGDAGGWGTPAVRGRRRLGDAGDWGTPAVGGRRRLPPWWRPTSLWELSWK